MENVKTFIPLPHVENDKRLKTKIRNTQTLKEVCFADVELVSKMMPMILERLDCAEDFYTVTIPFFQELCLKTKEFFPQNQVQLLTKDETVEISKEGAACLLGLCFFGFFDKQDARPQATGNTVAFNMFTFRVLWKSGLLSPLQSIIHYMNRFAKGSYLDMPVVLKRFVLPSDFKLDTSFKMCKVGVFAKVAIEDTKCELHADFANKYPGGGTLEGGCVQEEILFVIKPECLLSMLLVSRLEDNEAFAIEGAERFSNYAGYGRNWTWKSDYVDEGTPSAIIGVDASVNRFVHDSQFEEPLFGRDVKKMIAGLFKYKKDLTYATGNWGCGAFGGDKHLKALQQIIAASYIQMNLVYCTFSEKRLCDEIQAFVKEFEGFTIAQILGVLEQVKKGQIGSNNLLNLMIEKKVKN